MREVVEIESGDVVEMSDYDAILAVQAGTHSPVPAEVAVDQEPEEEPEEDEDED